MKQMRRLPRPRSMHDTTIAAESESTAIWLENAALSKLPVTPTRRDFGYFGSSGDVVERKEDQLPLAVISASGGELGCANLSPQKFSSVPILQITSPERLPAKPPSERLPGERSPDRLPSDGNVDQFQFQPLLLPRHDSIFSNFSLSSSTSTVTGVTEFRLD